MSVLPCPRAAAVVARVTTCHTRAAERAVAWRTDLERACAWTTAVREASAALRAGPLLGDCLTTLVNRAPTPNTADDRRATPPVRTASDARTPHRRSSTQLSTLDRSERHQDQCACEPYAHRPASWPLAACEVPAAVAAARRVDAASLLKWCGPLPQLLARAETRPAPCVKSTAAPVPRHEPPSGGWLRSAGDRAGARLRQEVAFAPPIAASAVAPAVDEDFDHARPEAQPVNGPEISADALRAFAAQRPTNRPPADRTPDRHFDRYTDRQGHPDRERRREATAPAGASRPIDADLAPTGVPTPDFAQSRAPQIVSPPNGCERPVEHDFGFPPLALEGRAPAAWPREAPARARADRDDPPRPPHLARPDRTSAFGARPDERDDDLEILAGKLERILTDEARRFGVDV